MPTIDLAFRLQGDRIPVDHGYQLYGALCRHLPQLHDQGAGEYWHNIAVHPINGRIAGDRQLALDFRSRLVLRAESTGIAELLNLAGKTLAIGDYRLQVTIPETRALIPASRLYSRLVVIKDAVKPEAFLESAQRQLEAMGIRGEAGLILRQNDRSLEGRHGREERSPFVRRTLRIHDKQVVGYAMEINGLSADDSMMLQERGIGGRRRFGCGVFVPSR